MKKVLILIVVMAIVVAGCCAKTIDGVTTKSFINCLSSAETILCNPHENVMAVARAAVPIIAFIVATALPGSQLLIDALAAQDVVGYIQGGACVSITQLNALIAFFKSADFQTAEISLQTKAMARMKAAPKAINPQVFVDWRDSFSR